MSYNLAEIKKVLEKFCTIQPLSSEEEIFINKFKRLVADKHALENILFIEALREGKMEGEKLFNRFISTSSKEQINISSDSLKKLNAFGAKVIKSLDKNKDETDDVQILRNNKLVKSQIHAASTGRVSIEDKKYKIKGGRIGTSKTFGQPANLQVLRLLWKNFAQQYIDLDYDNKFDANNNNIADNFELEIKQYMANLEACQLIMTKKYWFFDSFCQN